MTDEPIVIVRYDPDDLDQMMAIEVRAFTAPWSRQSYEDLVTLDSIHIWVAKQGDEVVGYMLYQFWADELELHNITTKPERERGGIGAMLMEHMLTQAGLIGIRRIYLLVRPSNEAARALYGKYGFTVVGVRHKYYRDNAENALLMCWDRDSREE